MKMILHSRILLLVQQAMLMLLLLLMKAVSILGDLTISDNVGNLPQIPQMLFTHPPGYGTILIITVSKNSQRLLVRNMQAMVLIFLEMLLVGEKASSA